MNEALNELLPRKVRLVLYVLASLVGVGVAAYNAANGDWNVFIGSIASALVTALAARNITPVPDPGPPDPPTIEEQHVPEPAEFPPADEHDAERRRFLDDYQGGAA